MLWIIAMGVLMGCSLSKKLTDKQKETSNQSNAIQVKEMITEPMISYIEVPVDCPETQENPSPPKIY